MKKNLPDQKHEGIFGRNIGVAGLASMMLVAVNSAPAADKPAAKRRA